ncbi:hypothetical protein K435DRAFT_32105 [Dendrothele bispora CBS 962.96]|uniref:Uncharacterized protein n=1 Tax=Dendrothele bispora (strain CBS 962.96) TaxID=1314807 RepID=A0A4S8KUM6_DENBC|nr:hypothetical protein K435DRAFT_32105 [Dendrothele bispora CBS 962.96]
MLRPVLFSLYHFPLILLSFPYFFLPQVRNVTSNPARKSLVFKLYTFLYVSQVKNRLSWFFLSPVHPKPTHVDPVLVR